MANSYLLTPSDTLYPSGTLYPSDTLVVDPSPGIASAEVVGQPVVGTSAVISPASIPSGEAFGGALFPSDTLYPGDTLYPERGLAILQAIGPVSVASAEAFGEPNVTFWDVTQFGRIGTPRIGLYPSSRWVPGRRIVAFDGRALLSGHGTLTVTLRNVRRRATVYLGGRGVLLVTAVRPTDPVGKLVETVRLAPLHHDLPLSADRETVRLEPLD